MRILTRFTNYLVICGLLSYSCTESHKYPLSSKTLSTKTELVSVKSILIEQGKFDEELVTNGRLEAKKKVDLYFSKDAAIIGMLTQEGRKVSAGTILAKLDQREAVENLRSIVIKKARAYIDYQDQLLRSGYSLKDTLNLPKNVREIAKLRSGLTGMEAEYVRASQELKDFIIKAPFKGKIANLRGKLYSTVRTSDQFCTIIDDSMLKAQFQIVEQELKYISVGSKVLIRPFSGSVNCSGTVATISPTVDRAGMIAVEADVSNANEKLLDGMSVQVIIKKPGGNMIMVPKSAVLDRNGKKVVFTLVNSVAIWNYVDIAKENADNYGISNGLKKGDMVIIQGNFNLTHNQPVRK